MAMDVPLCKKLLTILVQAGVLHHGGYGLQENKEVFFPVSSRNRREGRKDLAISFYLPMRHM
jgi:hypothetical protein